MHLWAGLAYTLAGVHASLAQPHPAIEGLAPLNEIPVLRTPAVHAAASRALAGSNEPFRFAEPFPVDVTPATHGRWEVTNEGRTAVWRLRTVSSGAVSLNLGFTRYRLPPGGRMRIHTPDGRDSIGPFTDADNETHGQLWTPILQGGDLVIELAVPPDRIGDVELTLGSVNRGFRNLGVALAGSHADCHIDVSCSAASAYRDQVRSVVLLSFQGGKVCSGFLVNNTAGGNKPYILTANHCVNLTDPPTMVVYWNYQRPTCGAASDGSKRQFQTGAVLLTVGPVHDFALLELDDDLDPAHNVYFAGWSRSRSLATSTVSIHHPQGHVKSMAFNDDPVISELFAIGSQVVRVPYLKVADHEQGATVPGSSGSPLFDQHKRVVGLHSAGPAACGGREPSWFAWLAAAWNQGTPRLLGGLLDPGGTGKAAIDGANLNASPETVGSLDDKSLRLVDGETARSLNVDIAHGFRDPDEDRLTYEATSSDENVATVAVAGSNISIAPVEPGTATITVTAKDDGGSNETANQTFLVTIGTNRSPETARGISPRVSLSADGTTRSIDIAGAFVDGDGDDLTYGALSTNEAVATVALDDTTVTVTPLAGGISTVSLLATDVDGSNTSARQSVEVRVTNRGPAAEGTLPSLSLRIETGSETIDVSGAFSDPDGHELSYEALSSNESRVAVATSGSELTVAPRAAGTATITVTATDAGGLTARQTFKATVVNRPPTALGSLTAPPLQVGGGGGESSTCRRPSRIPTATP